ncbi:MarR family winged helix-turn-helix transcriptional regulator [Planctomonas deserti]|uniref:MarR family winged helix-turn-helix transcriptional regulator n=1 Tax=Planctomonas deserti TaxID=2144185 RepID=UPI000D3574F5|nr:MarR family transcriptional regulator [Planctomonas deserti]
MTTTDPGVRRSEYWYPEDKDRAIGVLNALRAYRSAEVAMRKRTRDSMGMGETDLTAIRYLLEAERRGHAVTAKDLARRLEVSSASVTALIDRLVRSEHVRRDPHPTDRRSVIIVPTHDTDTEVRDTLGRMHDVMMEQAEALTPEEARVVERFLRGMAGALRAVDQAPSAANDL